MRSLPQPQETSYWKFDRDLDSQIPEYADIVVIVPKLPKNTKIWIGREISAAGVLGKQAKSSPKSRLKSKRGMPDLPYPERNMFRTRMAQKGSHMNTKSPQWLPEASRGFRSRRVRTELLKSHCGARFQRPPMGPRNPSVCSAPRQGGLQGYCLRGLG